MRAKIFFILIILAVLGALAAAYWFVLRPEKSTSEQTTLLPKQEAAAKDVDTKAATAPPEKITKYLKLIPAWGIDIAGDGSVSLKGNTASAGIRLTIAPPLEATEQYEIYLVSGTSQPEFLGTMQYVTSENEKYIWAAGGGPSWFGARSFMITRRKPPEPKPGTRVAEALVPAQ